LSIFMVRNLISFIWQNKFNIHGVAKLRRCVVAVVIMVIEDDFAS